MLDAAVPEVTLLVSAASVWGFEEWELLSLLGSPLGIALFVELSALDLSPFEYGLFEDEMLG